MLIGSNFFIIVAVGFMMRWLSKTSPAKVDFEGRKIMRPSNGYKIIAWFGFWFITVVELLFASTYFLEISWVAKPELYDIIVGVIVSMVFYSISIWLILYEKKTQIIFDDTKIIFQGIFGKPKEISWADIVKVTFSKPALQFYIETKDKKIPVHKHMSGFGEFKDMLKNNVNPALTERAFVDLDQVKGR